VDALNEPDRAIRFDYANLGRAGTNSSQALRRLPGQIASHRPDLLLVLTGNNDHHNLARSTYWRFQDASLTDGSIAAARFRVFLHSLRLLRLARTTWATVGGAPTPNEFFEDEPTAKKLPARVAIDPVTHRRQLEYNLTRLVELARKERIPIVFQTYFHFHGYRVNEIVRDVASTHGVPLVDHNLIFHTRLTAEGRESLRIPDGHPNPAGYAMMAMSIVELLEAEGIVPIAASRSREP
jgi:lysophospholipase L1-like esterase